MITNIFLCLLSFIFSIYVNLISFLQDITVAIEGIEQTYKHKLVWGWMLPSEVCDYFVLSSPCPSLHVLSCLFGIVQHCHIG